MATTPQSNDSTAVPTPTPAHLPEAAPQTTSPAVHTVPALKRRATPAKRPRKPVVKPATETTASPQSVAKQAAVKQPALKQPAVKQPAVKKMPARRAAAPKPQTPAASPKLQTPATHARKAAPPKATPANAALPTSASAKAVEPKLASSRPASSKTVSSKPASAKPAAAASAAKKPEAAKLKKEKLVRDSFTIPKSEFAVLDQLKRRAGVLARSVKKSELLRAGIKVLAGLSNDALLSALAQVPTIKTGRPMLKK